MECPVIIAVSAVVALALWLFWIILDSVIETEPERPEDRRGSAGAVLPRLLIRQRNWEGRAMRYEDIKAELRRSACEDKYPYLDVKQEAFDYAFTWSESKRYFNPSSDNVRTFFLLVAEAMVYADT